MAITPSSAPESLRSSDANSQVYMSSRRAISDDGNTFAYIERKDDFVFPYEDLVVEDQTRHIKLYVTSQNYSWMTAPPEISYYELSADGRSIIFMTDSVLPIPVFWHIPSWGLARTDYHNGVTNLYHAELRDTNNNLSLRRVDRINTSMQDRSAGGCLVDTSEGVHCYGNDSSVSDASNSADGRFVVFASRATNLLPGLGDGYSKIYLYDTQTRQLSAPIPRCATAEQFSPTISKDGQRIAFQERSNGEQNCPRVSSVRLWDANSSIPQALSVTAQGNLANRSNFRPRISSDGQSVAFASSSSNMVGSIVQGINNSAIYIWRAGNIQPVSQYRDSNTTRTFLDEAISPTLSADGQWVSFLSASPEMTPCAATPLPQLYRWDNRSKMISSHGRENIVGGSMSDNGRWVLLLRLQNDGYLAIDREFGFGQDFDGQTATLASSQICSATSTPFKNWCAANPGQIAIWHHAPGHTLNPGSTLTLLGTQDPGLSIGSQYPEASRGVSSDYGYDDLDASIDWITGSLSLHADPFAIPGSYNAGNWITDYCNATKSAPVSFTLQKTAAAPNKPLIGAVILHPLPGDPRVADITYVFSAIDSGTQARIRMRSDSGFRVLDPTGQATNPEIATPSAYPLDNNLSGTALAVTFRVSSSQTWAAPSNVGHRMTLTVPGIQAINASGGSELTTISSVLIK